jgi:hypothetical protein
MKKMKCCEYNPCDHFDNSSGVGQYLPLESLIYLVNATLYLIDPFVACNENEVLWMGSQNFFIKSSRGIFLVLKTIHDPKTGILKNSSDHLSIKFMQRTLSCKLDQFVAVNISLLVLKQSSLRRESVNFVKNFLIGSNCKIIGHSKVISINIKLVI